MWLSRKFEHRPLREYLNNPKEIGQGVASIVYESTYKGQAIAIKIFRIHPNLLMYERNLRELIVLSREITPYLNYLVDYTIDFASNNIAYVFIKAEDLKAYRSKVSNSNLLFKQMVDLFISNAFLQSKNIIHRDIKPQNALIKDNHSYLTDFDLARINFCQNNENLTHPIETVWYRAPEIMMNMRYNFKIDTWSMCITFIEIMTNGLPVYGIPGEERLITPNAVFRRFVGYLGPSQKDQWLVRHWRYFSNQDLDEYYQNYNGPLLDNEQLLNNDMKQFVRFLLVYDPDNRPSAVQTLEHPFIRPHLGNFNINSVNLNCQQKAMTYNYYPTFNWPIVMKNMQNINYSNKDAYKYRYLISQQFDSLTKDARVKILMLYLLDRLVELNFKLSNDVSILNYTIKYIHYIADSMYETLFTTEPEKLLNEQNSDRQSQILKLFRDIIYTLDGDLIFSSAYDFWETYNSDKDEDEKIRHANLMFELQQTHLAFNYTPYDLYNTYVNNPDLIRNEMVKFQQNLI